jgi:aminodeoxyfutalosine deaminase
MTPRLLVADAILPGDGPPIRDGAVALDEAGEILDVGAAAHVVAQYAGVKVERVAGAILPGLVNAHTHVELSALRGKVPGGDGFVPWLERMLAVRFANRPESDAAAIASAVTEIDRSCTAAVGEVTNTLSAVDELRAHGIAGIVLHESFGFVKDRVVAAAAANEAARAARGPSWPGPDLTYAPAPHTLYTTHPDAVRHLLRLARASGARTSIHLAEHPAERAFLLDKTGPFARIAQNPTLGVESFPAAGKGPIDLAADLGLLAPDVLLVHLNDAREAEIRKIAESGAPVVVCPRSNVHIEGRPPPVAAMLAAGIVPALGTDSLASNTSLDVMQEAVAIAAAYPDIAPGTIVQMATWAGARAIGRTDLGRIAKGARPGLLAVTGIFDATADPAAWVLAQPASNRSWIARRRTAA